MNIQYVLVILLCGVSGLMIGRERLRRLENQRRRRFVERVRTALGVPEVSE